MYFGLFIKRYLKFHSDILQMYLEYQLGYLIGVSQCPENSADEASLSPLQEQDSLDPKSSGKAPARV